MLPQSDPENPSIIEALTTVAIDFFMKKTLSLLDTLVCVTIALAIYRLWLS